MIQLKHISKYFGKFNVLNDINLVLKGGECIALIGPNGSGKTTLIKSILAMVVPTNGDILFEAQHIQHQWNYRKDIGYMPQIGQYPENMTIGQVFDMMKDIRKLPENQMDMELYHAFHMAQMLGKRMGTLSGGTRQKVSACLAFMFCPKALILDEPTAGLDPLSTEILKEKIKKEKSKNRLIIISSHVLSDLDDLVSEIVYLQEGKLIFHKTLQTLKDDTETDRLSKAIARVMSKSKQEN